VEIEAEVGHAVLVVRTVAFEAVVGEDGADFAVEVDGGPEGKGQDEGEGQVRRVHVAMY
jgi:hypothetical protein